jgi:hypothetical protein
LLSLSSSLLWIWEGEGSCRSRDRDWFCVIISFGAVTERGVRWGDLTTVVPCQHPQWNAGLKLIVTCYCRLKHTTVTFHILKEYTLVTLHQTAYIFISYVLTSIAWVNFVLKFVDNKPLYTNVLFFNSKYLESCYYYASYGFYRQTRTYTGSFSGERRRNTHAQMETDANYLLLV